MAESIEDTIRRSAALARLELSEDEVRTLVPQFTRILDAFRQLAAFPADEAPADGDAGPHGRTRPDEPGASLPPEVQLAGAPRAVDGFYAVPRTVGGDA